MLHEHTLYILYLLKDSVSHTLNLLFIGDIVGTVGLQACVAALPALREKYSSDCIIINGENICNGKGLTEVEANRLFQAGAHVITTGNHIWENWKSRPLLANNRLVLRPLNYPRDNPGKGYAIVSIGTEYKVGVLQLQGRVYMPPIDCPFAAADRAVARIQTETNIIFVDMHAEATAEKIALGWHLDGRVSAVAGTHTHVQTADARILPKGTAYITDVGMTGPYDSVIGMQKEIALRRFMLQTAHKYEVATGDVRVCGIHVAVDSSTGMAKAIENFTVPDLQQERTRA